MNLKFILARLFSECLYWHLISFKEITYSSFMNLFLAMLYIWDFPGSSEVKESACNVEDLGSVPGLGRSPGEGNGNPLSILAWRIPWTEEPGGLQSKGSQRVGHD